MGGGPRPPPVCIWGTGENSIDTPQSGPLALGHEIVAVLAVVAAFFSGLALGAYSLDGIMRRTRFPGRWYGALEAVIGTWSLALVLLMPVANRFAAGLIGVDPSPLQQWSIAFLWPFLLLLPATVAMGGTLPAMERLVSRLRRDGWSVGGLYAANTFGAVVGTLGSTFLLVPTLGFTSTLLLLAALNFICAAGVYLGSVRQEGWLRKISLDIPDLPSRSGLLVIIFMTGLLGIGYEVVIVRVISQLLENTVYTFASVLSVYLLGTALGAALYQRFATRRGFRAELSRLLQGTLVACLIGISFLWLSSDLYAVVRSGFGSGFAGSVGGELAVALAVFFLPTLMMGATFSHLAQAARDRVGLGVALGLNTLGAALAPLLFGIILLPAWSSKVTLLLISASSQTYDVIIADLFHPARDGAGSLYTIEHFAAVRELLGEDGLFCQWLPLYQLDLETLRGIVATYLEVFPEGSAYLAHFSLQAPILGLISRTPAGGYPADWLTKPVQDKALQRVLAELRLQNLYDLFGHYLAGDQELREFAAGAPINSDDRPTVLFQAPQFAYADPQPAHQRLLKLVDRFQPEPAEVLTASSGASDAHHRLAQYWEARNRFLHLGVGVHRTEDATELVARIGQPLLELVRLSPDFDAAYRPLLAMARKLRSQDALASKALLLAMAEANPQRLEAKWQIDQLFRLK